MTLIVGEWTPLLNVFFAAPVKYASLLFFEELNPDEIRATKISLGRRGRQTHTE